MKKPPQPSRRIRKVNTKPTSKRPTPVVEEATISSDDPETPDPDPMASVDSPEGQRMTSIIPYVDPEHETSLEKIYGKKGVPGDNVLSFPGLPAPIGRGTLSGKSETEAARAIAALDKRIADRKAKEDKEKMAAVTPKHPVTVVKNPSFSYPELWWKVYIQGPRWEEAAFADMFTRAKCSRADSLEEADLVVFTGGEDVNPKLYGARPHPLSSWNDDRDTQDILAYARCHALGIPMLGVCRGAQFLSVMQGGKLYQHVTGHNGDHKLYDYKIKKQINVVSSVHHQMVMRNTEGGMEVLAVCPTRAKERWIDDKEKDETFKGADTEVFFYRDAMILGVQGHPEYKNYPEFTQYVLGTMVDYFATHPDCHFIRPSGEKGPMYLRIKPEILAERDSRTMKSRPTFA